MIKHLFLLLSFIAISAFTAYAGECGMGNQCPIMDTLLANPYPANPGQVIEITATAHDPDGSITRYNFTATGGAFENSLPSIDYYTNSLNQTTYWTAPTTTGTYTITARVWDNGGIIGNPTSGTVSVKNINISVQTANQAPVISSLTADKTSVYLGGTSLITAIASDSDGDPITYSWSATSGTITGDGDADPNVVTFTAPSVITTSSVTCNVTDGRGGSSSKSISIFVSDALPSVSISDSSLYSPVDVGIDSLGYFFVADPVSSGIIIFNPTGEYSSKIITSGTPISVAIDFNDRVVSGIKETGEVVVMSREGSFQFALGGGIGEFMSPVAIDIDRVGRRYIILDQAVARVHVYDESGISLFSFGSSGDGADQLKSPSSVAYSPSQGRFYVADSGHNMIKYYDNNGVFLSSFGGMGGEVSKFIQLQAVKLDSDNKVYTSDAFQSRLQVFTANGTYLEMIGSYGDGPGGLKTPLGIGITNQYRKLAIASSNTSRIEIYDLSGSSPPPVNTPPSLPAPYSPAPSASIYYLSPLVLTSYNSSDPDYQSLSYNFELYFDDPVNGLTLVWQDTVPQGSSGSTSDTVSVSLQLGSFLWRVRAYDGIDYSGWSSNMQFTTTDIPDANLPPDDPVLIAPISSATVTSLMPTLTINDAIDPNGDTLTYSYEIFVDSPAGLVIVASATDVPSTEWTVGFDLDSSQTYYWRSRAYDGKAYGPYSLMESFMSPAFAIPDANAYGNIPAGDNSRDAEVRYLIPASQTDVTIYYQAFDSAKDEIEILIDGNYLANVPISGADSWTPTSTFVVIPAAMLSATEPKALFFHRPNPDWNNHFGIKNVSTQSPPIPMISAIPYNTVIDIRWNESPDIESQGYSIILYRAYQPDGPFTVLGKFSISQAIYRDINLTNGITYYYRAAYVDIADYEGLSSAVVSESPAGSNMTPVTDLKVNKNGNDASLIWSIITTSTDIQKYEIYRDAIGSFTPDTSGFTNLIGIVSSGEGIFGDTGAIVNPDNVWYSVIPVDMGNQRALP